MLRTVRSFWRLTVIARTLARHDALAALEVTGIAKPLVHGARFVSRRRVQGRPGEKLARALTDLGPSFIKLGQFMSTRADLVGEEVATDLAELQDHLPPFPSEEAREIIEKDLGATLETLFESFDETPRSAASIAQVHMAVTSDGRPVAVKVLRPGIERAFEGDMALFYWLAGLAERTQPWLRRLKPVALVRLFEEQVRIEMDLAVEAAAADELAQNFADDPTYNVPAIDWTRTSMRILTAQRISGTPIDDRAALIAAGHDLEAILDKAAAIFFKQVFRDGFFHGDQHPGNMFIDENGNIVAVDFGIMGRLDRDTRIFLADMLISLLDRDYRQLAEVFVEAGYLPRPTAEGTHALPVFAQALRSVCEPIFGQPLEHISLARLLAQLFKLSESFQMEVQPQLLLLQKNMMMSEGVSRSLRPELNIWTLAEPLTIQWIRENRGPEARIADTAHHVATFAKRLPKTLSRIEQIVEDVHERGLRLDAGAAGERRDGWVKLAVFLGATGFGLGLAALVLAL